MVSPFGGNTDNCFVRGGAAGDAVDARSQLWQGLQSISGGIPIIRAVTYLAPYPDQAVLQGGSKLAGKGRIILIYNLHR
jgi:hypothetical protein